MGVVSTTASVRTCRLCQGPLAAPVASFPAVPVAGCAALEVAAPLSLCRCAGCGLVQLSEPVESLPATAAGAPQLLPAPLAKAINKSLPPHARVAMIGGQEEQTAGHGGPAHTVLALDVFDTAADPAVLFAAIDRAADLHTRLIVQTPDLRRMVEHRRYAAVRHVRQSYYDAASMSRLLDRFGWSARGAVSLAGGHLVVWAARQEYRDANWVLPIAGSLAAAVPELALRGFAAAWQEACGKTRQMIESLLTSGETIAAYGHPAEVVAALGPAGLQAGWLEAIYDSRTPAAAASRANFDQPGVLLVADPDEEAALVRGVSRLKRAARTFFSLSTLPLQLIEFASPTHPHYPEAA